MRRQWWLRRKMASIAILGALIALAAIGAGWLAAERRSLAQSDADRERPEAAPPHVAVEHGPSVVKLDAATQRRGGITVEPLRQAPFRAELRAYASVLDVTKLNEIASAYAAAQAQLRSAQAKLEASRSAFDRAKGLYKDQQNVSAAQLQSAETAFRTDEAALAAAASQTRMLAASAKQEWGQPLGVGIIEGSPAVTRLIERQDLLVQVTLAPGTVIAQPPASAEIQAPDGARAALRFLSPAAHADPRIQGLSFFYTVIDGSGLLPGMNVLAFLPADKSAEGLLVPASAIVQWQGKDWIYLRIDAETFMRRDIPTDMPGPNGGYVVAALPADAQVVTLGAQMLLSQELKPQLPSENED
jgi:hypothetical protein